MDGSLVHDCGWQVGQKSKASESETERSAINSRGQNRKMGFCWPPGGGSKVERPDTGNRPLSFSLLIILKKAQFTLARAYESLDSDACPHNRRSKKPRK
jgi:hypothetical protein